MLLLPVYVSHVYCHRRYQLRTFLLQKGRGVDYAEPEKPDRKSPTRRADLSYSRPPAPHTAGLLD